ESFHMILSVLSPAGILAENVFPPPVCLQRAADGSSPRTGNLKIIPPTVQNHVVLNPGVRGGEPAQRVRAPRTVHDVFGLEGLHALGGTGRKTRHGGGRNDRPRGGSDR